MKKVFDSSNSTTKICHIISGDLWAGAEVQLMTTLEHLNNYKFLEISVIALNNGTLAEKVLSLGMPVFVIDEKRNNFIRILIKAYNIVSNIQPDIIHSHRYKENLFASLLGIVFPKIRKVRTQHTTFLTLNPSDSFKIRFYRKIDIITSKLFADKVIAVSEDIARQVSACIGEDRVITINNFVDPQKVLGEANYNELRDWDVDDFFLIGTAGRLNDVKGYKYLIKAAKLMCKEVSDVKFIIVGSGPLRHALEIQIKKAGLNNKVILTGFRNDVKNIIQSLNIFVMTSLYEGIPMVMLEAMALEKAIVATNVGGIPELIQDNHNGILIETQNEKMIYDRCMYLYRNKRLREVLAQNAFNTVKTKFNSHNHGDKIITVYKNIL